MAVSDYNTLRNELRMNVRDTYGIQWSDTALDNIINDARKEYSFYAQNLVGEFEIKSSAYGILQLPEDFISPIRITDTEGLEIPVLSWRELVNECGDFRKVKGDKAQYCCFDFDGYTYMRIFPQIPANINVGKLIYTRYSKDDVWEEKNYEAIKEHCLFQMTFILRQNRYMEHFKNFMRSVDEENRSNHTLKNRKKYNAGVYF